MAAFVSAGWSMSRRLPSRAKAEALQGAGEGMAQGGAAVTPMFLHFEYPRGAYWFSSARWQAKSIWLTLQGPGWVAVQSVFERPELAGAVKQSSGATTQYW